MSDICFSNKCMLHKDFSSKDTFYFIIKHKSKIYEALKEQNIQDDKLYQIIDICLRRFDIAVPNILFSQSDHKFDILKIAYLMREFINTNNENFLDMAVKICEYYNSKNSIDIDYLNIAIHYYYLSKHKKSPLHDIVNIPKIHILINIYNSFMLWPAKEHENFLMDKLYEFYYGEYIVFYTCLFEKQYNCLLKFAVSVTACGIIVKYCIKTNCLTELKQSKFFDYVCPEFTPCVIAHGLPVRSDNTLIHRIQQTLGKIKFIYIHEVLIYKLIEQQNFITRFPVNITKKILQFYMS